MKYEYIGKTPIVKFDKFDDAFSILNKLRHGKINLADARSDQENCKSDLGEIKRGNNKKRSQEKENGLYNIDMLYKSRNEVIKFYDHYSLMVSKAKTKTKTGTGLKILNPKQLLQRLPITLSQVKASNNSECLLS